MKIKNLPISKTVSVRVYTIKSTGSGANIIDLFAGSFEKIPVDLLNKECDPLWVYDDSFQICIS